MKSSHTNENEIPVTIIGESHNRDLGRIYLISLIQALDDKTAKGSILLLENVTYNLHNPLTPKLNLDSISGIAKGPFSYASLVEVANKKGVTVYGLENPMKSMRFDLNNPEEQQKRLQKNSDYKETIDTCKVRLSPANIICLVGTAHVHADLNDYKITGLAELCSGSKAITVGHDNQTTTPATVQNIQMQDPKQALKDAFEKSKIMTNGFPEYKKNDETNNWELQVQILEDKKTSKTMNKILSAVADIKGIACRMEGKKFTLEFTDLGKAPEALQALNNSINNTINEKLTTKQTNTPKISLFSIFSKKASGQKTDATKEVEKSPKPK